MMGSSASTININSFHEACRRGDLERVNELLPTMTYEMINRQDSDGKTPLHYACEQDHKEIVSLLLNDRDLCSRKILNKKGLTAYKSVKSDDIRHLFSRPSTSKDHRFFDENPTVSLQPTLQTTNSSSSSSVPIPNNWVRGHTDIENAVDGQFMIALSNAPKLLKIALEMRTEREAQENFEILLKKCIENASTKERVMKEYHQYKRTKSIETLLTIYSLETPIYGALRKETSAFTTLIFLHLDQLANRAYKGQTYRGTGMTSSDVDAYKWAHNCKDYLLETRVFQSTSKCKEIAKAFNASVSTTDIISVLLIFNFYEKCSTAIELLELANIVDEEEVLLLPFTLFKVETITTDSNNKVYEINLTCMSLNPKNLFCHHLEIYKK